MPGTQTDPAWWRERADSVKKELVELDGRIEEINQRRKILQFARRQALRRVHYLEEEKVGTASGKDLFYIMTPDLLPYLDRYYREVGPEGGGWKALARKAAVDMKTISRIRKGKTETTTFQVADRILTAMGITDALDEEIIVYTRGAEEG